MTRVSSPIIYLEQFRQQFPALNNKAYFNYGGQGPMPQGAISAIHQAHEYVQRCGPFSGEVNSWLEQEGKRMREVMAAELGTTADTITLTEDVTVGCNIALWGIDWQAGDHILLTDCEHPGVIAAVLEIQRRFGVEVSTCPIMATLNAGDPVEVITQNLRPTTRLLVVSHILWNTGQVLPLADMVQACHRYPAAKQIRVLVDAAQSVGVLPLELDQLRADFYAFTGHKWWCGPAGVGGLYVHPDAFSSLSPTFIGWRSITKSATGYPTGWQPDGQRFEVATSDYTLYSGLRSSIAVHHQWGSAADRYQQIMRLSQYLWERLLDLPDVTCLRMAPPQSGLVAFQMQQGNHGPIVRKLEKQGFLLRTLLDPDCIRACVHYFTLESELDRLVEAIRSL